MPIVDLRGARAERGAQILQMMNQMRNRNSGQPSALEELNKQYEKLQADQREEDRKNREAQSQINARDAATRQGQQKVDTEGWKAGQEDVRDWRADTRAERKLEQIEIPESKSKLEDTSAGIGLKKAQKADVETDIEGKRKEQDRKAKEAAVSNARLVENDAIRRVTMGETLSQSDTDALQDARRVLSGNPGYVIPRKPDGSWEVPKNVQRGMLDKNDIPAIGYAKGVEGLDTEKSPYGKLVGDATRARLNGAGPEVLALYADKFFKENALNKNQLEWRFAKKFIDVGDFEGAQKIVQGLQAQKGLQLKLPSVEERQEFGRQTRLVDDMDVLGQEFDRLTSNGLMPVGSLKQPFYQILRVAERDNPEVAAFIKRVERVKGEYLLYLSGRAATDAERDDLINRIPTIFDSPQTFRLSLPQFREKVAKDMSIDAGILKSFNMVVPDGIPIVDPWDIIKRGEKLPNLILQNGYIPGDYAENHLKGINVLGGQVGTNIGGQGEFRQKPLGPQDQLGESTEAGPAPGKLEPIERNTLQREADELRRQLGVK